MSSGSKSKTNPRNSDETNTLRQILSKSMGCKYYYFNLANWNQSFIHFFGDRKFEFWGARMTRIRQWESLESEEFDGLILVVLARQNSNLRSPKRKQFIKAIGGKTLTRYLIKAKSMVQDTLFGGLIRTFQKRQFSMSGESAAHHFFYFAR